MDDYTSHLLLVILIIPALGLLCLLVVCLLQSAASTGQGLSTACKASIPILKIEDAFDPERSILWYPQVPFLQAIAANASLGDCLRVCQRTLRQYPELYEGTSAESWLRLLQRNNLAEVAGMRIRLTNDGRELLRLLLYQTSRAVSRN